MNKEVKNIDDNENLDKVEEDIKEVDNEAILEEKYSEHIDSKKVEKNQDTNAKNIKDTDLESMVERNMSEQEENEGESKDTSKEINSKTNIENSEGLRECYSSDNPKKSIEGFVGEMKELLCIGETKKLLCEIKGYCMSNKPVVIVSSILALSVLININMFINQGKIKSDYTEKVNNLNYANSKAEDRIKSNSELVETLNSKIEEQETTITKLEVKLDEAGPWFELNEEQQNTVKAKIEEWKAQEKARIEAEEKAKAEAEAKRLEEERKAKEKAEKEKYNTGITYDQLARTPDDYFLKLCKFRGKVLQVSEGSEVNGIRLAVNGNYDKVIYIEYDPTELNSRILEDDYITVSGISMGIYSYQSVLGNTISIPSMIANMIDLK